MSKFIPMVEVLEDRMMLSASPFRMDLPRPGASVIIKSLPSLTLEGGERDIAASAFSVSAKHGGHLNEVKLTAALRSAALSNIKSASLWMDRDRNGSYETRLSTVTPTATGVVDFHLARGFRQPVGPRPVNFLVKMDLEDDLVGHSIGLKLAEVRLQTPRGVRLQSQYISYSGAQPTLHVIAQEPERGSLFVTQDSVPVPAQYLLGGTVSTVQRLQFHAEDEAVDVTALHFSVVGGQSVDRLELYKEGSATPFASATVGATGSDIVPTIYQGQSVTTFTARMDAGQLIIPDGQDTDILVKARIKTDTDGGISGESVQVVLINTFVLNEATGEGAVHARGVISRENLTANNGNAVAEGEVFLGTSVASASSNVVGPKHTVVMSEISSVSNANPDANGTAVPTGVSGIGQFRITAAAHSNSKNGLNGVVIDQLTFIVYATNVAIDVASFKVYNKSNASMTQACTATAVSPGVYRVTCSGLAASAIDTVLDQGTQQTFVLQANVMNPMVDSRLASSLQVVADFGKDFRWYDRDAATLIDAAFSGMDFSNPLVPSTRYES